jgi:hypothetical protein
LKQALYPAARFDYLNKYPDEKSLKDSVLMAKNARDDQSKLNTITRAAKKSTKGSKVPIPITQKANTSTANRLQVADTINNNRTQKANTSVTNVTATSSQKANYRVNSRSHKTGNVAINSTQITDTSSSSSSTTLLRDASSKKKTISSTSSSDVVEYFQELPSTSSSEFNSSKIPNLTSRLRRASNIDQDQIFICVCGCNQYFPKSKLVTCKGCNEYVSKSCCSNWRCNKLNCKVNN